MEQEAKGKSHLKIPNFTMNISKAVNADYSQIQKFSEESKSQ